MGNCASENNGVVPSQDDGVGVVATVGDAVDDTCSSAHSTDAMGIVPPSQDAGVGEAVAEHLPSHCHWMFGDDRDEMAALIELRDATNYMQWRKTREDGICWSLA